MQLSIKHRGKLVQIPVQVTERTTLGELRETIASTIGSESDKTKLLTGGRSLGVNEDEKLISELLLNKKQPVTIIVMASKLASINEIKLNTDSRLLNEYRIHDDVDMHNKGRTVIPKFIGKPSKTRNNNLSNNEYGFGVIESLKEYSDSHRAQAILERLASDSGILYVMREKKWKVGALREMKPQGRVGLDPCLMGYNVGKGMEIRLRLRTDDESGFRSISQLLQVLSHELAHNVESEHGVAFKETMRWIERSLDKKDWRGLGGKLLSDGSNVQAVSSNSIADQRHFHHSHSTQSSGRTLGGNLAHSRLVVEAEERGDRLTGNSGSDANNDSNCDSKNSSGQNLE